ncbi:MAG TPA: MG2 domain-containing protein [Bacteroidales bacterium]|nr:MG2 domain-containing protein [Bacteroidales bacterium]
MKAAKITLLVLLTILWSCGPGKEKEGGEKTHAVIPVDQGFTEYIVSYTSGIIAVNGAVEIRFTPEFAKKADKSKLTGLFSFDPSIKGKAEWKDDVTLVFRPAKLLDYGKTWTGSLSLSKLGEVKSRLKSFPINIETVKKDFNVTLNNLEYLPDKEQYSISGQVITSDYVNPDEVEEWVNGKLSGSNVTLAWDHTSADNVHKFTIEKITRTDSEQNLVISWDGNDFGVKQSASSTIKIPKKNDFIIQSVTLVTGESQHVDIVFSDPVDAGQETEGLVYFTPSAELSLKINSNVVSVYPTSVLQGSVEMNIEGSIKSNKGIALGTPHKETLEFTTIKPGLQTVGKGVILPASGSLVFPFMAVNLKAVDIRIIKIYENNLPYLLQNDDLNEQSESVKRFGRPVYAGKIDLLTTQGTNNGKWNLHTIDLADYITVEPGVLYKVKLTMRKSYSLYSCNDNQGPSKYEQALDVVNEKIAASFDDPGDYYEDSESSLFYRYGYNWEEKDDPCKDAFYSPYKGISKNLLASNLGLMAKQGENNKLLVFVNDIRSTDPVGDAAVEALNLQMQPIGSGNTASDGTVTVTCSGKPFLLIVKKGNDRNYLKTTDYSSLSLSSFDVSGVKPEKGIKTYIYGERDVWRPGDSIYLAVMIRDMNHELPEGHPVQFELVNPDDQKIDNQVQNLPASGLLVFRTKTSDNAVTGNYSANIRVGGALFSKRVRVETIKPNRLKIDLTFSNELLSCGPVPEPASMKVKWLNGAVAKNMNAIVDVILRPVQTRFDKYPQYVFDDPSSKFSSATTKVFDGSIDNQGNSSFQYAPGDNSNAPGMLNAVFTARVFEKGGDASIIQKTCKLSPFNEFVGISFPGLSGKSRLLYTDATNEIRVATVDKTGKPVSAKVEVDIYRISYRWWWESDEEDLGTFVSNEHFKPIVTGKINTVNGEGSFTFKIPKDEWGRYLVKARAESGHTTGKIILVDWPWEYGSKGVTEGATLLTVGTDKAKYNVGDNIQLSFPAPPNSRAIVTLENATGVVEQTSVSANGPNSIVNLKATADMAPNVYAYVTLIQPHGQTQNDMPIRLYGVAPVMVEDAATRLTPQISMPDEIRSQKTFEVRVSETGKRPMTYTLAVVDEGLLDITGFRTPDPWSYFYAREALGVRTWDLYDLVLGALGGKLDRALATGGDEALKDKSAAKVKRFIPVVRFFGPYDLPAGRTNTHKITLPLYTGSVKAMVIGGNDKAYGAADKSVLVRDPLMILATAPRVLGPGEKVSLPVTAFVQKEGIKKVTIEVKGNDLVNFTQNTREISVTEPGEKDVDFEFTAAEKTGKAEITVTATGAGETATYKMELEIRSPNPMETRSELKILNPNEKYEKTFIPFGIEGTSSASIEISTLPSINLGKRLSYLIEYPHGCSEQITSAVFPQLWVKEIGGTSQDVINRASENVAAGIQKLVTRQMANGGIALWPGSMEPDKWVTSYAGHFMLEAEKLGYSIPSGFRQKWLSFQRKSAQSWRFDRNFRYTANEQAYRLFTLALAGQPDKGAMNRLRETPDLPQLSKWMLGAAFALAGRTEVAESLIDTRNLVTEQDYYDYYYGGYLRDREIILYTLVILKKYDQAFPLLKSVCEDLNRDYWYSTQAIAWGLFSYMKFAETISPDNGKASKVSCNFNGEKKEIRVIQRMTSNEELKIKAGTNSLSVANVSETPVYLTFIQKGIPLKTDILKEDKGLSMNVSYLNMERKAVDEKSIEQGTDFIMVVKVANSTFRRVDNIALTEMVPPGWEIRNTRLFEAESDLKESPYDYRDFRDDRVYTYFGLGSGESKTFIIFLNASYKGQYFQPAVWCEAMYNDNMYSRIPGKEVSVTGQKIE